MIHFSSLGWKNFLSTGREWTTLDLSENPATLIIGENGSGKSTMLDALTFGLYGRPFRKINKPQLVNSVNKKDCLVQVEFRVGGNLYTVRRGMNPSVFEIYVHGELLDQDAKMRDYQERLEKNILKINYKSFTQIIVLGSSTFLPFMKLNPAHRREVIEDLLEIEVFSLMNGILRMKQADNSYHISDNKIAINMTEEKISLQERYIREVDEIKNNKIQETEGSLEENRQKLVTNESKVRALLENQDMVKTFLEERAQMIVDHNMFQGYKTKILDRILRIKDEISSYKEMGICQVCKQKVDDDHKHDIINDKTDEMLECEDGIVKLDETLQASKESIEEFDKYKELSDSVDEEVKKLDTESNSIRKYVEMLIRDIEYLTKVKDKAGQDHDKLDGYKTQLLELKKEAVEIHDTRNYLDVASDMLKDTGIKTLIIRQYLPIMNKLINKYLTDMDSYFDFHLDENFSEIIRANFRDTFTYDSFSEGEKMRIDLALLFTWRAIAKMKNSADTNLLILDEVFDSSLDTNGTEEFLKILQTMGSGNVFIISHKGDTLNEKFDNVIKFEKVKNFSKIA